MIILSYQGSYNQDFAIKNNEDWDWMMRHWTQQDGTEREESVIELSSFFTPEEADGSFPFVSITIDNMPPSTNLEDSLSDTINAYTQADPPRQIISSSIGDLTLAGMPAYSLEYTLTDPGSGPQRVLEVGTIIDNKEYFVSYLAEPHIYQKYLPIIREMISSMQLISDTGVPVLGSDQTTGSDGDDGSSVGGNMAGTTGGATNMTRDATEVGGGGGSLEEGLFGDSG